MSDEEVEAARKRLEEALQEYLNLDQGMPVVMTGYVAYIVGIDFAEGDQRDIGSYIIGEQSIWQAIGLTEALKHEVIKDYDQSIGYRGE